MGLYFTVIPNAVHLFVGLFYPFYHRVKYVQGHWFIDWFIDGGNDELSL